MDITILHIIGGLGVLLVTVGITIQLTDKLVDKHKKKESDNNE